MSVEQKHDESSLVDDLHNSLPTAPEDPSDEYVAPKDGEFTLVLGRMPFKASNVRLGHEEEDIAKYINNHTTEPTNRSLRACLMGMCCATGIGACYLWNKMVLVNEGEYGITLNNGIYEMLPPGRHTLASPLHTFVGKYRATEPLIQVGPITIVRVQQGQFGFAYNNSKPEVLLPGLHVRKNAQFVFLQFRSTLEELIEFGPIKILTVKSGFVRVCFVNGKVRILPEGRYAVNYATFQVITRPLSVTQENLEFSKHRVMLDGGINMLVQAQLTYRVTHVEKLIKQIGTKLDDNSDEDSVEGVIERVTSAEISRVFSSIHLEQIASATEQRKRETLLGDKVVESGELEGEMRSRICHAIIEAIKPIIEPWGVRVINFQINSCIFADVQFAQEYEAASLAISKAKAQLRSTAAENEIKISVSKANAESLRLVADGQKEVMTMNAKGESESKMLLAQADAKVMMILAEADAQARKLEAAARNKAADMMSDDFARQYAMAGQQVEFAHNLKATTLTVLPDSVIGKPIVSTLLSSK